MGIWSRLRNRRRDQEDDIAADQEERADAGLAQHHHEREEDPCGLLQRKNRVIHDHSKCSDATQALQAREPFTPAARRGAEG